MKHVLKMRYVSKLPKYTKLIFRGSFPTREHRSFRRLIRFYMQNMLRTKPVIQSDFLGPPDSEAPSRQVTAIALNHPTPFTVRT